LGAAGPKQHIQFTVLISGLIFIALKPPSDLHHSMEQP